MDEIQQLLALPSRALANLDIIWSFGLLLARYSGLFLVAPGIGGGERGMFIRYPAIILLSAVSVPVSAYAPVPDSPIDMGVQFSCEFLCGLAIGLIPFLVIAGVQMGAQIASTSMGLGVSQLIDPTSGVQVSDLSRIYGDLSVIIFLYIGGHLALLQAASGLGGALPPGTFTPDNFTTEFLINQTAHVFEIGTMVSVPIVVALLLTQFVMGLISKAVPTVNIFIVSFPLTIGIGLALAILLVPELVVYVQREFSGVEPALLTLLQSR